MLETDTLFNNNNNNNKEHNDDLISFPNEKDYQLDHNSHNSEEDNNNSDKEIEINRFQKDDKSKENLNDSSEIKNHEDQEEDQEHHHHSQNELSSNSSFNQKQKEQEKQLQDREKEQVATRKFTKEQIRNEIEAEFKSRKRLENKYCSWCFASSTHILIEKNLMSRNIYKCLHCSQLTCCCTLCSLGMTRYYKETNQADKTCYSCSKQIPCWGKGGLTSPIGWCSWCFQNCRQTLYIASYLMRNTFECTNCSQKTVPCRKCGTSAFARSGVGMVDDQMCALHQGQIESWESPNKQKQSLQLWCSWCASHSIHELSEYHFMKRNVFFCTVCKGPGVVCKKCSIGMARTGVLINERHCLVCSNNMNWTTLSEKKNIVFSQRTHDRIIAELQRKSIWRTKAEALGLIRPFLLLVSTQPIFRIQIGNMLGLSIFEKQFFGDPHQEAWYLLSDTGKSFEANVKNSFEKVITSSTYNWADILVALLNKVLKYPINLEKTGALTRPYIQEACIQSKELLLPELEELFLSVFFKEIIEKKMTSEQRREVHSLIEKEENEMIATRIRQNANITRHEVTNYGISVTKAMFSKRIGTAALLRTASSYIPVIAPVLAPPLVVLGVIAWPMMIFGAASLTYQGVELLLGASEERILFPTQIILLSRLLLAVEGIKIENYY